MRIQAASRDHCSMLQQSLFKLSTLIVQFAVLGRVFVSSPTVYRSYWLPYVSLKVMSTGVRIAVYDQGTELSQQRSGSP